MIRLEGYSNSHFLVPDNLRIGLFIDKQSTTYQQTKDNKEQYAPLQTATSWRSIKTPTTTACITALVGVEPTLHLILQDSRFLPTEAVQFDNKRYYAPKNGEIEIICRLSTYLQVW